MVFLQKDVTGIANSGVFSGSALFAQTYLSKNFGSLQYSVMLSSQSFRRTQTAGSGAESG